MDDQPVNRAFLSPRSLLRIGQSVFKIVFETNEKDSPSDTITIIKIGYREVAPGFHCALEPHARGQVVFLLQGSLCLEAGEDSHVLSPEQVFLLPPEREGELHAPSDSTAYLWASITGPEHGLTWDKPLSITPDQRPDLRLLVQEVCQAGSTNRQLEQSLLARLLLSLSAESGKSESTRISPLNEKTHDSLVARVEAFMKENLTEPITRQEIAAYTHLSAVHLSRLFRSATHKSLMQRLTELRIERAKQLLLESDLPITRIGLDVGFNSFSYFSRAFKKHLGISPSEYRKSGGISFGGSPGL